MTTTDVILFIITPTILVILPIIVLGIHKRHFEVKPKLLLKLGHPLYEQKFLGYSDGRHELKWRYECVITNNSIYPAYNIKIDGLKDDYSKILIKENVHLIKNKLPENNNLKEHEAIQLIIKTTHITKPYELLNYTIENGQRIILPGMKIENPEKVFKPVQLEDLKFVLTYKNSYGKTFYSTFEKKQNEEKCIFHSSYYKFWIK